MASGSGQVRLANTMKKIVSSVCDVTTMMSEITNAAMNKYGAYMRSIVLLRNWINGAAKYRTDVRANYCICHITGAGN